MGGVKSLSGVKSRWGKVIGGVKSRWGKVMGGVKSRWGERIYCTLWEMMFFIIDL